MARLIVECYRDPEMAEKIGSTADDFVRRNFSPESVMPRLIKFYQGFISV